MRCDKRVEINTSQKFYTLLEDIKRLEENTLSDIDCVIKDYTFI